MAGSGTAHLRDHPDVVLRAEHLVVEFPLRRGRRVHAVSDVSLDVVKGETLGLVGESGCGKSTTARALMQLPPPTAGKVLFEGGELTSLSRRDLRALRPRFQMVFQDPISSLNPRKRVTDIVGLPLRVWASSRHPSTARVDEVLDAVGLDPARVGGRRPRQLSGGQCQRVSIARALVLEPRLLVCDEPVSSLDVSVQAQILNLLQRMKARYGLTMVFIAHDLAVVKNVSDRIAVMYMGKLCEVAPADDLYRRPAHPYTRALIASIPVPDPSRRGDVPATLAGEPPSSVEPPIGCRFQTRCPRATDRCLVEEPVIRELRPGHFAACHHPVEEAVTGRLGDEGRGLPEERPQGRP